MNEILDISKNLFCINTEKADLFAIKSQTNYETLELDLLFIIKQHIKLNQNFFEKSKTEKNQLYTEGLDYSETLPGYLYRHCSIPSLSLFYNIPVQLQIFHYKSSTKLYRQKYTEKDLRKFSKFVLSLYDKPKLLAQIILAGYTADATLCFQVLDALFAIISIISSKISIRTQQKFGNDLLLNIFIHIFDKKFENKAYNQTVEAAHKYFVDELLNYVIVLLISNNSKEFKSFLQDSYIREFVINLLYTFETGFHHLLPNLEVDSQIMPTELDFYLTSNIKYLISDFTKRLGKKSILLPYKIRCILKNTILLVEKSLNKEIGSDYLLTLVAGMHRDLFELVIKDILIYPEKYNLLNTLDITSISFGQRIFLTKIFCIIKDILDHCQCNLNGKNDLITSTLFVANPSHHDFFNKVMSNFNSYFIHMAHEATTNAHVDNDVKYPNSLVNKGHFSTQKRYSPYIIIPMKDLSNLISFCKLSAAYFDSTNEEQLQTLLLMLDSLPPMEIDPVVASPKSSPQTPRLQKIDQSPLTTGAGLAEKLKNLNAKLITPNATPSSLRKRLGHSSPFQNNITTPFNNNTNRPSNGHLLGSPNYKGSELGNGALPPFRKLSGLLSPPHPMKRDVSISDGNNDERSNILELIVLPLEVDQADVHGSAVPHTWTSDELYGLQWPCYGDGFSPSIMTEREFNLANPIDPIESSTTTPLNGVLKKRTRFSLSTLAQDSPPHIPLYNEGGPYYPTAPIDHSDSAAELGKDPSRPLDPEGAGSLVVETDVDQNYADADADTDIVDDGIARAGEEGGRTGSGSRSSSRSDDPDREGGDDLNGAVEEEGENASVFGCVSTVGTPPLILSGRESPQSEISLLEVVDGSIREEPLTSTSDPKVSMTERLKQQQRREIHDKFGKFDDVKPIIAPISSALTSGRIQHQAQDFDENVSLISETWSTEVLASDTEGGASTQSFPWTLGSGSNQRSLSTPNPFKIASIPESPIASYLNGGGQSSDIGDAGSESAWSTEAHAASEYEGPCQEAAYPQPKTESRLDILVASNTSPPPPCSVFAGESCRQNINRQAYLQAGRDRERIYSESCFISTQINAGQFETKLIYSQNSMSPDPSMAIARSSNFAENPQSTIISIPEDKVEKVNTLESGKITQSNDINEIPHSSVMDSILSNFDPLATNVILGSIDNQSNMTNSIPGIYTLTSGAPLYNVESSSKFNRMIGDHFKFKPNNPSLSFFKATSFDSPISKVQNFLLPNRFSQPNNGDKIMPPHSLGLGSDTNSLLSSDLALDPSSSMAQYPSVRAESPILAAKSSLLKGLQTLKTKVHYSLQQNQPIIAVHQNGPSQANTVNVPSQHMENSLEATTDGETAMVQANSKSLTLTDEYVESLRSPLRLLNLRQEYSMASLSRPDLDLDSVCDTLVSIFSSPLSSISTSYEAGYTYGTTIISMDSTHLTNGHCTINNELAGDSELSTTAQELLGAIDAEMDRRMLYGDMDSVSSLKLIAHYLQASPNKVHELQKRLQLILAKKRAYLKYLIKTKGEVLNVRRSLESKLIAMNRAWNANENLLASLAVQEFLTRHANAIKIFSQEFVKLPTPDEKSDLMADFASKLRAQLLHYFPDASESSFGGVGIPSTSRDSTFCETHARALTNGNRLNQFPHHRSPCLSRNADDSIQRLYLSSYSPLMVPMDNNNNLATPIIPFPVIRFNFDPCFECVSKSDSNPPTTLHQEEDRRESRREWRLSVLWPHVERHLYTCVFHSAMYPNGDGDQLRDQLFERHITRLASTLAHDHKDLRIPPKNMSHFPWLEAQHILTGINVAVAPVDKLCHVVRTCLAVVRSLRPSRDTPIATTWSSTSCSADDVIPVLTYVVLRSNPGSLLSNLQFVEHYHFARPGGGSHVAGHMMGSHVTGGEVSYWWTQFRSVVEFIKTMEYEEED